MDNDRLIIETADIFAEIGQAILWLNRQDGQRDCYILYWNKKKPVECCAHNLQWFDELELESKTVRRIKFLDLWQLLQDEYLNYQTYTFIIDGLDESMGGNVRDSAIKTAEELCAEQPTYDFVYHRLLGREIPQRKFYNIENAINRAELQHTKIIKVFYEKVRKYRDTCVQFQQLLITLGIDPMSESYNKLVDNGEITDLIEAGHSHNWSKYLSVRLSQTELKASSRVHKRSVIHQNV